MIRTLRVPVLIWIILLVSGCLPSPAAEPIPASETPAPSPISTATRVWFPETATPTLRILPTVTPTPVRLPMYSSLQLEDDFKASAAWNPGGYAAGNIAFGDHVLNLAVSAPNSTLTSLRRNLLLGDFFWEVTVTPNLCGPADSFGLLFWALNEQSVTRLAFDCTGRYSLERVKDLRATPVLDWKASSQVPRGSLTPLRVGLWSGGGLVRIYLNDNFQDESYLVPGSGAIGFFASSGGSGIVNISFSDMQIYHVGPEFYPPTPSPTLRPTKTAYPTQPTP